MAIPNRVVADIEAVGGCEESWWGWCGGGMSVNKRNQEEEGEGMNRKERRRSESGSTVAEGERRRREKRRKGMGKEEKG